MSTHTLVPRFSKAVIAIAVLAVGFGFQTASAALLTVVQAKADAALISNYSLYNSAFASARQLTADTGAEYAAANARLIASHVDGDNLTALLAIINGISYNYPNQQAAIITQVISANDQTRENAAKIIMALGSSLSYDTASQLAVSLNYSLLKDGYTRKKAGVLAYTLLSSINNSTTGTAEQRANEMAIAAANLAANLLTSDQHGNASKSNQSAFTQIVYVLSAFAQSADTGSLTRDQLIHNIVGYFTATLQKSAQSGLLTSTQVTATLLKTEILLLKALPKYSSTITAVIQSVLAQGQNFGAITPSETPH